MGFEFAPLPNVSGHIVLTRDGYAALIPVSNGELGDPGSPGLATSEGLAVLVWRGEEAWFVRKGFERKAHPAEIEALRVFLRDVKSSLMR